MRSSRASVAVALLLALTGCATATPDGEPSRGSGGPSSGSSSGPRDSSAGPSGAAATSAGSATSATASWRSCDPAEAAKAGPVLARVRWRAGAQPATVRLASGPGPCRGGLLSVTAEGVSGTSVADLDLDPGSVRTVRLRGAESRSLLMVEDRPHPRGGAQTHLFADGPQGLRELTVDGSPLLPFVATDGGGAPMGATCTDGGGLAVWTARTHEPPGVILAWDVYRTRYALAGDQVRRTSSGLVEQAVADPLLGKDRPFLFSGRLLTDCSAPAT